jgi:hypothetical protein
MGATALHYTAKTLDYLDNLARAATAKQIDPLVKGAQAAKAWAGDKPLAEAIAEAPGLTGSIKETQAIPPELAQASPWEQTQAIMARDPMAKALRGETTGTADYLATAGADPESPITKAAGFTGDVLISPTGATTKAAKLAKAVPGVGKVVEGVGKGLGWVGKVGQRTGMAKVNQRAKEKGYRLVTDVLDKYGFQAGTLGQTKNAMDDISEQLSKNRDVIYDRVAAQGKKVDVIDAVDEADKFVTKLATKPNKPQAKAMRAWVDDYLAKADAGGKVDIKTASDWKTDLYNSLPDSAFDAHGRTGS